MIIYIFALIGLGVILYFVSILMFLVANALIYGVMYTVFCMLDIRYSLRPSAPKGWRLAWALAWRFPVHPFVAAWRRLFGPDCYTTQITGKKWVYIPLWRIERKLEGK